MPVIPANQLDLLRDQHPHTARVEWFLAVAPYGTACFTAQVNDPAGALGRGSMVIPYDGDIGEDDVEAGMTLWVGSPGEVGSYDAGRVRIKAIDTAANTITVAENSEIAWLDNQELMCPGAYGFRELWGKYPLMTEAGGTVDFFMDYDEDFTSPEDTVLPPKANGGPPAVGWIDPTTGLATVDFTGDRSYTTELGGAIANYLWTFPGALPIYEVPALDHLVLWLDADAIIGLVNGDPVVTWADQSGLGNDVTQGVAANQPTYRTGIINGYPAVLFDGGNDYLSRAAAVLNQIDGWTIVVVMQPTGLGTNRRAAVHIGDGGSGFGTLSSGNIAGRISTLYGGVAWNDTNTAYVNDTPCIITSQRLSGTLTMYRDGVELAPTFANIPTLPAASTYVGWNGFHNYHSGYIAEVLVYDIALDDARRELLDQYLGHKYGIAVPAGDAHSVQQGTCAAPVEVQWNTPGFRYVSLTVMDDTAQERQATVYVPVWIFEEGTEDPFKLAEILSQDCDTENGWRLRARVFQTNTAAEDIIYHWPDGALCVLFTRTWYGDTETGVGGWCMASDKHYRDNIRFVGWLLGESLAFDHAAGTVEFEAVAHDGIMRLIPGWPFTIEDTEGDPVDWYEVADLNVDRALHYLLEFYSTVNQVCHVERVGEGNTRTLKIQSYSDAALYDQAQGDLLGDAKCLLLSDRQGILYATRDPQFMDAADRALVDVACHLQQINPNGQADWVNDIDQDHPHRPAAGMARVGGFAYETPLLARAPGAAPVQNASEERVDGLIVQDQTEMNLWAGLTLTKANLDYPQVPLELVGYWPVFDPAYQEYVQLTAADPLDRRDWTAQKFIVRQMSFDDRVKDGTAMTNLVFEKPSQILTGETVTVPETPTPTPPPLPTPYIPPPWGGDLSHVIIMTTSGIFATETFNEVTPIWFPVNAGLSGNVIANLHDMSFDFNHGSRLFMVSDHAADGGAFRCNDVWNQDAWTQQLINAQAITLIVVCPCLTCYDIDPAWPTYPGIWSCVNCDPITSHIELIAGAGVVGAGGCNSHKRAFYSGDALDTIALGDVLTHDPPAGNCGVDHCATPYVGNISTSGGHSLYTYNCAWGAGGDLHRGLSTDGGATVDTSLGQVVAWSGGSFWHTRTGAEAAAWYANAGALSLYYSADHGATFAAVGGGGTLPVAVSNLKHALAMHNLNTSNIFYIDTGGVLRKSTDQALTWVLPTTTPANINVVVPAMVGGFPEGQAFIAGCSATPFVYLTVDFGESWQDKTGNLDTWLSADDILQIIPVQGEP